MRSASWLAWVAWMGLAGCGTRTGLGTDPDWMGDDAVAGRAEGQAGSGSDGASGVHGWDAEGSSEDVHDLARGVGIDPTQVHFVVGAERYPGASCFHTAVVHWDAPGRLWAGFESCGATSHGTMRIEPVTGEVIVATRFPFESPTWRTWRPDGEWAWDPETYPMSPGDNDERVPRPACGGVERLTDWVFTKPEGSYVYTCADTVHAGDGRDLVLPPDTAIIAVTYGELALVATEAALALVDLASGVLVEVTGLEAIARPRVGPVRAAEDGFHARVWDGFATVTEDEYDLWHIDRAGAAELVGTYPPPPEGTTPEQPGRLDADLNLVQVAQSNPGRYPDLIVTRSIDGRSEIAYDLAYYVDLADGRPSVWDVFTGP